MPIARSNTSAQDAAFCLPTGHLSYRLLPNGHVLVSELFYSEIRAPGPAGREECITYSQRGVFDQIGVETCKDLERAGLARGAELRVAKLVSSGETEHIYPDARTKADPVAVEKMHQCLAHHNHTRFDALGIESGRTTVPDVAPTVGQNFSKKLDAVDGMTRQPAAASGAQFSL